MEHRKLLSPARVRAPRRPWRLATTAAALFVAASAATRPAIAQCQVGWLSSTAVQHSNPNTSSLDRGVHALAVLPNGDLVAGGQFDSIGGVSANNIARWDGSAWHPLGSGIQQIPSGAASIYQVPVRALVVLPNGDLVAGGAFTSAGGSSASNLARWDGQVWSQYGGGLAGRVYNLAMRPNGNLIAVVGTQVLQWDGTSWATIGTATIGNPLTVNAIAVLPGGNVVAAGNFYSIGGVTAYDIAVWNGTAWSAMGNFNSAGEVTSLAVLPTGDLIAGSSTSGYSFPPPPIHVQRWNGVSWSSLGVMQQGSSGSFLPVRAHALAPLADGRLVLAGDFYSIGSVPTTDGFAIWDGAGWSPMVSGQPAGVDVRTLAATPDGFLFAGGLGAVGRWGCRASGTRFGAGCYMLADTFYEAFPPANFDLGQSTLRMVQTPSGYTVTPIAGAPTFVTPTAPNLMLGDDAVTGTIQLPFQIPYPGGTTNQIVIGSNGYVFLQPSTDSAPFYSTTALPLLSGAVRHAALWSDLDPTSGVGTVHCDIDTTTQTVCATWLNVAEWNAPSAVSTFQIAMSANGTVEYRYQNCATSVAPALTGWSPGNGAIDRGGRDISAGGAFQTSNPPGVLPLEHDATSPPALGATATLTTTNIPAGVPFGATVLSWTRHDPGLDLGNMGMPGCRQYVGLDMVAAFLPVGASASHSFAVPNMTALLGAHVFTQGIVFAPGVNALGALTSNGVDLHFGWQ